MSELFASSVMRRRIVLLSLVELIWGFGWYFVLATTTIPAYLLSLGASPLAIGVMASVMAALPLLLQFFGRNLLDRFSNRRWGLIIMHFGMIIAYLLVPVADFFLREHYPRLLVATVIGLVAFGQIVLGLVTPLWLDMVAQIIPPAGRGRYFGISAFASAMGGILGGLGLAALQHELGPAVFRGAFLTAGGCFAVAILVLALVPVPESTFAHPPEPSVLVRIRKALTGVSLRGDLGRFILSYCLQLFAGVIIFFLFTYITDKRGLGYTREIFTTLTILQALGGAVGALALGWLVDHYGMRWPWVGITCVVPLLVLLIPHGGLLPMLYACTLLSGMLMTHWSVGMPALLALTPPGDKSGYISLTNLFALVPTALGPLLLGRIIQGSGYHAAFGFAATAGIFALLVALTIRGHAVDRAMSPSADMTAPEYHSGGDQD